MCDLSKFFDFFLFADDTNTFFSHQNLNFIWKTLNEELLYLTDWCWANRLSIKIIKSNFMVFKPRQKRENLNIKLEINQWTIDRVKESAFLGVILDENFSWKPHIANIARKVSKSIGIIHKASLCLSTSTLCTFHNSLVYPYFFYCIRVWGSTYPSTLKRTVLLQTKVVRITSRSTFHAHTKPVFKQLKILNLYNIYRFQIGNIIFLFDRLFTWCSLKIILFSSSNHCYYTRQWIPFAYPLCRTNIKQFALCFQGIHFLILWI